jgi:hypothetical protein
MPTISDVFCEGYGDFALQSSDGVTFYFPSFLLSYISPVFKDMIAAGDTANKNDTEPAETSHTTYDPIKRVELTEHSRAIDAFLRHIDPNQSTPVLGEYEIRYLLEAGRKYQVPTIATWFEAEATKRVLSPHDPDPDVGQSLLTRKPALVISLAMEYNIKPLAQRAIQYRAGHTSLGRDDIGMGEKAWSHICYFRQRRTELYLKVLRELSSMPPERNSDGREASSTCGECKYQRSTWMIDIVEAILENPRWEVFSDIIGSRLLSCSGPRSDCQIWVSQAKSLANNKKYEINREETKTPWLER